MEDIYNTPIILDRIVRKIKKDKISEVNKKLIFDFQRYLVLNNLSQKWVIKCVGGMRFIALSLKKDFDKVNKEDIEVFIQKLQESNYSPLSKSGYKAILKKFYKWLKGDNATYPPEVAWIKTTVKRNERRLPGEADLLTEGEIKKLIDVAEHPRDKALVSVLYEAGCRVGELGSIRIKDVNFDKYGALVHVSGKTGPRTVRLISSVPFLSNWINNHPIKDDRNCSLWISVGCKKHNKPLLYNGVYFLLRRLFKKAKISKRFNPHLFRHSRATFMANHLTEFQMNQYFGWVQGSGMPSTYVHLSGKNVDNAILELNGIKQDKKESKESNLKPKKCQRCDTINSFNDKFCSKCGGVLDIKTAIELDENIKKERKARNISDTLFNTLMKDKGFQETLIKKAMELGIGEELLKSF